MGTVTKLVRSIRAQDHPILSAMKRARRFEELNVSNVDWNALEKDLANDVANSKVLDEIGDAHLYAKRYDRARDFWEAIQKARDLFNADCDDDQRIYRYCKFPVSNLHDVLSNLETAGREALNSLKGVSRWKTTEQSFLYCVTKSMAQTFERCFKLEAKPYTSRNESPRRDGPFLRMAQFALREYGDEPYELSSIATELDKIRAEANRSANTVPAPEEQ